MLKRILFAVFLAAMIPAMPALAEADPLGRPEPTPYYSDEKFSQFLDKQEDLYNSGKEQKAVMTVCQYILGRHCSYAQVHEALERGFVTDYIDRFKASGLLEQDYTLPSGVVPKRGPSLVDGGSEEHRAIADVEGTTLTHDVEDFDVDNINNIANLLYDIDPTDAYVMAPVSLEDKKIPGGLVTLSFCNGEQLSINFTGDDGKIKYGWSFYDVLYEGPEDGWIDLSLDYDQGDGKKGRSGHLKYDLGELAKPVILHLSTPEGEEEGADFVVVDSEGNIIDSATSENGYATFRQLPASGDFTLKREKIRVSQNAAENVNNKAPEWLDPGKLKNWPIIVTIVVLMGAAIGLIVYGIKKNGKR